VIGTSDRTPYIYELAGITFQR